MHERYEKNFIKKYVNIYKKYIYFMYTLLFLKVIKMYQK